MDRLDELRAKWHAASETGKHQEAIAVLCELERLEPHDPLWSQRLAETYRRSGQQKEAVDAFARAFERYFDRGFVPRAIAMAKLVKSLDPARGDLLEAHLSAGHGRDVADAPVPTPKRPRVAGGHGGLPAAAEPAPFDLDAQREASLVVPAKPVRPMVLARAEDSLIDEVRFGDAAGSALKFSLVEVGGSDVIELTDDDDDDAPPTRPLGPSEARRAPKPDPYATMATFRLFASLPPAALLALANASELVEFIPNAMIIVRDERAFALYAIVSGSAHVTVFGTGATVRLKEGDVFGEASLLDDGQRQASVKAETALMTLRIEKHALDAVMQEHPEVEDALFDLLAHRLVGNLMSSSPLFVPFEPPVRLELARAFEIRRAPSGTTLAESGRRSDGLYVLLAGHVTAQSGGAVATRVARGTVFGHASLLGVTADTTVRAVTEAVVLRMPAAKFIELAANYPPVLAHLAETAGDPLPASEREPR